MPGPDVWDIRPEDLFVAGYDLWTDEITATLKTIYNNWVPRIITWMQQNATWQDQTGEARRQLTAEVHEIGDAIFMSISHGVPYGIWLEIANQGRYGIIGPAFDYLCANLWSDIEQAML